MFNDNKNFYPTPKNIITKMLAGIDFHKITSVLEPSAGKGDIAEEIINKFRYAYSGYSKKSVYDIDTIEIDTSLQHILKGKNFRLVHDDFMTFESLKRYNLIIMNPPFNAGDIHLLKAIQMQEKGGKVVCLLNAETLKNAYSKNRITLLEKLNEYNAEIEYIQNAFIDAERKTGVEIALIKIDIPYANNRSIILNGLKQEEESTREEKQNNSEQIINADFLKGIVEQYNFEVKAGITLIDEWNAMKANMFKGCELTITTANNDNNLYNAYIRNVRSKYWNTLFRSNEFMGLFTSNLRELFINKINELVEYDFSLFNIYSIRIQLNNEMIKGVEETILTLFDEFSNKHHYYDETSKNIHLFNGWKTNKAWKINEKVIIPLNGFNWYNKDQIDYDYKTRAKLEDIEKVFNYLDGGITENVSIDDSLKLAQNYSETKKIPLKYFTVSFYKKGTCHIEFTNEALLHKFNIFGAQKKNWLPPTYGKKPYNNMTTEEKAVVVDFEGETSYNKVIQDSNYYITDIAKVLMITQ